MFKTIVIAVLLCFTSCLIFLAVSLTTTKTTNENQNIINNTTDKHVSTNKTDTQTENIKKTTQSTDQPSTSSTFKSDISDKYGNRHYSTQSNADRQTDLVELRLIITNWIMWVEHYGNMIFLMEICGDDVDCVYETSFNYSSTHYY